VRYAFLVCAGVLFACGAVGRADTKKEPTTKEKPGGKFLTKDGRLTKELQVHEVQGGGIASKARRWTVQPDGSWELAVRDVGVKETKGKLTKGQLAKLAAELEKYRVDVLPSLNPKRMVPGAKSYEVRYGDRQVSTVGPLPKPDVKTVKGRYAGVVAALEELLVSPTEKPAGRE
jgi:hypothetical protein